MRADSELVERVRHKPSALVDFVHRDLLKGFDRRLLALGEGERVLIRAVQRSTGAVGLGRGIDGILFQVCRPVECGEDGTFHVVRPIDVHRWSDHSEARGYVDGIRAPHFEDAGDDRWR